MRLAVLFAGRRSRRPASQQTASARLAVEVPEGRCLLSASGSISGTVLEDLIGNGISMDDQPAKGWTVNLFRDNGDGTFDAERDTLVGRDKSSGNGHYEFRRLPAGVYFVREELPPG